MPRKLWKRSLKEILLVLVKEAVLEEVVGVMGEVEADRGVARSNLLGVVPSLQKLEEEQVQLNQHPLLSNYICEEMDKSRINAFYIAKVI